MTVSVSASPSSVGDEQRVEDSEGEECKDSGGEGGLPRKFITLFHVPLRLPPSDERRPSGWRLSVIGCRNVEAPAIVASLNVFYCGVRLLRCEGFEASTPAATPAEKLELFRIADG